MTRARILRLSLLALAVLAMAWLALRPAAIPVDTVVVDRGPIVDVIAAEGRTRLVDRYLITAPIAGQARRQQLEVGDGIEVDQVLVVLDPLSAPALDARSLAEARARADAAESRLHGAGEDLGAAQVAARQAASELARLETLAGQSLVAREAVEKARTAAQRAMREEASARFREATARHELEGARAALALRSHRAGEPPAMELAAPVAGVVLRRFYESSRPVQTGEPLIEIGDPAAMEIEVDVLSADAVRLRDGMPVELLRWGDPEPLAGRVRRVEPAGFTKVSALGVEEQRVWVIVEITSERERWQRLGDAYRVNAHFAVESRDEVLRLPGSALFRNTDGGWSVFLIEKDKARIMPVQRGLQGGTWVEITDGLAIGDVVVVHPDRALEDASRVRIR